MHAVCAHGGFFRKKGKNNFGGHKKSPIFVNVILKTIFLPKWKRLIPIEDLKRSPVKVVAFFYVLR